MLRPEDYLGRAREALAPGISPGGESVLRVYPDGAAAAENAFQSRLEGRQRQFEQVARAFGAYGEAVSDPGQVAGAIERCLAALDAGQAAVLAVRVTPL